MSSGDRGPPEDIEGGPGMGPGGPPRRDSRSPSPRGRGGGGGGGAGGRRGGGGGQRRRGRRSRSLSRSRSPPRGRSRSYSPDRRGRGRGGRSRSPPPRRSYSRSRSRSPPRGRSPRGGGGRYRDYYRDRDRDRGRDRFGPPPHGGHGPPGDYGRGGYGDYGGPPHHHGGDPYYDGYGGYGGPGGPPRGPPPRRDRGGSRGRRDEGPPGVSLLVRNVSPDITTQDLQMAFGRIGDVRDVYIPRDFHSQQPKGFAFVEYATPEMAREAREEMNRFVMKGRELEVVFAQERRKTPNEMRGRVVDGRESQPSGGSDRGGGDRRARSSSFERHQRNKREGQRGGRQGGDDLRNSDDQRGENGHGPQDRP